MPEARAGTYGIAIDGAHLIGVDPPNLTEWSGVPGFSTQTLFEVTAGELPPGMSIAQKAVGTGTTNQFGWKGIPTELGVFNVTIGPSGTFPGGEYEWTISLAGGCPLVELAPDTPLPEVSVGLPVSIVITASEGVEPYVYEVVAGVLPDGLTLSEDGLLSGTPTTRGDYAFTIRATDDNGCPGITAYTLSVGGLRIEVDGVNKILEIEQADFELGLNRRSTAHLVFGDGYIPDRLADVVIYARDGATAIFGGIILKRRVKGLVNGILASATEAECVDYSVYFDDASVTLSYDAPVAVEDVIADVVYQALEPYGLTYTPVATGLTLEPFSWVDVVVTDAFKQISDKTGLVFRTTPTKEIEVFVPGSDAAPVSITDANINAFDLEWEDDSRLTANTVELLCGPSGPGLMSQEWTADGIASSWVTDLPAIDPPPILVEIDDGVTPRRATVVPAGTAGGQFEWDRDTHTLSLGTDPLPAAGTIIRLGKTPNFDDSPFTYYTVQFPFKVRVTTGEEPPITYREARPDCVEYGPALELANGILDRESTPRRDLEVITDEDGFLPGQALTVDTTARGGLDAEFLVATVRGHIVNALHWDYTLTTQEGAAYRGSYVDQWKALTSGGAVGVGSPATVTAPVSQPTVNVYGEVPSGDIDGVNVEYTTNFDYQPGSLRVYVGLRQKGTDHYTETGPNTFEMNTPLDGSDVLQVDYIRVAGTESIVGPEGPAGADGAMVLLASQEASSDAQIDFTTRNAAGQSGDIFQSDFDLYLIALLNVIPATDDVTFSLRVSTDGGSTYDSGANYKFSYSYKNTAGADGVVGNAAATSFEICGNLDNAAAGGLSGFYRLYNPLSAATRKFLEGVIGFLHNDANYYKTDHGDWYISTSPVDALRFFMSSGDIASGLFQVFGVKKS